MVAYSFKPRFVDAIRSGEKKQTIRAERQRHARIGEELQLYTGMRTKSCALIGRATCLGVEPIRLYLKVGQVILEQRAIFETPQERLLFARLDGFASWAELKQFWADNQVPFG